MNYLDLINNVLRRLREDEVSSVHQNNKSSIVADFINDAKRHVEESWDWSCLRTDITVPTAAGTAEYTLEGSQGRETVLDVRNVTSGSMVNKRPTAWGRRQDLTDQGQGVPHWWVYADGLDAGDTKVKFFPTPDGVYSIKFHVVQRTADLEEAGDTTDLPHQPIIHLALAMSATERGGVQGTPTQELYTIARNSLNRAIQYDVARHGEESIWYPV
jgi:hypothetical protein